MMQKLRIEKLMEMKDSLFKIGAENPLNIPDENNTIIPLKGQMAEFGLDDPFFVDPYTRWRYKSKKRE